MPNTIRAEHTTTLISRIGLIFIGFTAGLASSSLGIGGGLILMPAFLFLFRYTPSMAAGTSLATMVPMAAIGLTTHYLLQGSNIQWQTVFLLTIGSLLGARYGSYVAAYLNKRMFSILFSLLLIFTSLQFTGIISFSQVIAVKQAASILLPAIGMFAGICSALFGIGGGIITVPLLSLMFGFSIHEAIATSLAVILPTTLAGALFHHKFKNINEKGLIFLIPASLFGAMIGAVMAINLPADLLKTAFSILLILCAGKLIYGLDIKSMPSTIIKNMRISP